MASGRGYVRTSWEGVYPVIVHAVDAAGNAAEPMRTPVVVEAQPEIAVADERLALPDVYALAAPYPNPLNSRVVLQCALPEPADVELVAFNLQGQAMRRPVAAPQPAGHYRVAWDGRDDQGRQVGAGLHLVRSRAGGFEQVHKMALVK